MDRYMKIADELARQNLLTGNGGPSGSIWPRMRKRLIERYPIDMILFPGI